MKRYLYYPISFAALILLTFSVSAEAQTRNHRPVRQTRVSMDTTVPMTSQENPAKDRIAFESAPILTVVEMIASFYGGLDIKVEAPVEGKLYSGTPTGTMQQQLQQVLAPHGLRAEMANFTITIKSAAEQRVHDGRYLARQDGETPQSHDGLYMGRQGGRTSTRRLLEQQLIKRLERQFEAESTWGAFEIKKIPGSMAEKVQVFAVLPGGVRKYVTGADTVNNWHEEPQPVPTSTESLEFVFVDRGMIRVVTLPVMIAPSFIKNSVAQITLTANQFDNAREATHLRHHRIVENADGTFVEIIQSDPKDWQKLTDEQKALMKAPKK